MAGERLHPDEEVLISSEQIQHRLQEVVSEIKEKHPDMKEITLVGILTGGVVASFLLGTELEKTIDVDGRFIGISSYGRGKESSKNPIVVLGIEPESIKDKHVIIVDDVLDEGHTVNLAQNLLGAMGPKTLETFVLAIKNGKQETSAKADYVLFHLPGDKWLFGSGMDKDGSHRRFANFIGAVNV